MAPCALQRTETERFHSFSYEDLIKRDKANLDIFWLRDDSLGDSSDLPAPAILAADLAAKGETPKRILATD